MKTKKKRVGTKAQIRAIKNRERRIITAIFLAFILLIVVFSAYFTYTFLSPSQNQTRNPASSQLKAAIVDHLSLTMPNQTFIETATNTLKQAGYTVDYYPGEKVTVEFYRNLPTHAYEIIVLRVHSTASYSNVMKGPVTLFTSEHYNKRKYVHEQLTDQLVRVAFSQYELEMGIPYFGVRPCFITQNLNGRFQNAITIMMGCEGLDNTLMAKAFVEKGAKAYISWSKSVSASHTDQATTQLLKHLITEKQTIEQAVTETMKEVGADPAYKSLLIYYPLEAGEQTIENITSNPTTKP
jgi:hypothetical protein